MGASASCCEPDGACGGCAGPLPEVNLQGPAQECPSRGGKNNYLIVHVSSGESERLRSNLSVGRHCAIEVEARVLRGRVTNLALSVNKNPKGTRVKLAALPVHPEPEQGMGQQGQAQAWGNAFQPGFSPQHAAAAQGQQQGNDLGPGGCRMRLMAAHTNNFEPGADYYLTWNAIVPGSILVKVTTLVEQVPGQGLQPLQVVTFQQRLLPDMNLNFGNQQVQLAPAQQPSSPFAQQQQQPMMPQQPLAPRGPYSGAAPYPPQPYSPSMGHPSQMSPGDAALHIRNLEVQIAEQNAEIASLKKSNRSLDEKLYNAERGRGASGATELQINRYKEYILRAKDVIAQQKERIVDLETTTLVGRLEAHLLEYKEYASRQKLKLAELSQDLEGTDREVRELRDEAEELRARYEALKSKSADRAVREEPSPRRTPHYSRQRSTTGSLALSGSMRLPGAYDDPLGGPAGLASPGPYSHEAALRNWEHEGLRAPKTPTAATWGRDRERDAYGRGVAPVGYDRRDDRRDEYAREGDLSRDPRDVRAREDVRREHEREWSREYERAHGYAPAPGANPYSRPAVGAATSPYPAAAAVGARHRNAVSRPPRAGTKHYYDYYGGVTDRGARAAMKIQAAWRGYVYRKRHRRSSSTGRASSTLRKSTTTHVPAGHRSSSTTSRPASSTAYSGSSSAYSSSRKQLAPVSSSSRPASSTHRSSSTRRRTPTREEEDKAARKIQSSYRNHLSRKRSSSSHHRSGSTHKSSTTSSRDREREREREKERERERDRDREREREKERDREGRSSSKHHTSSRR